ncbi:MAG: DUF3486 family protein [Lachnospiraceae bacterium]|nr:DUF3486 family protein [Lachnospiraceae bacterium]
MEEQNRSHGKIDGLPTELKHEVENRLLNGETYEDISSYLREQGEEVHLSSVGRYGRKFLKRFESVRVAKEFAKLLAEDNADRPSTELHEANNLLASQLIMEAMVNDDMEPDERAGIAKSIASLQRAQVSNEKLKLEARKESGAVHVALNMMKEKVFAEIGANYPEIAQTLLTLAEETESEMSKV